MGFKIETAIFNTLTIIIVIFIANNDKTKGEHLTNIIQDLVQMKRTCVSFFGKKRRAKKKTKKNGSKDPRS